MRHVQLFISTVSDEFKQYREAVRSVLQRHNVTVQIQEDFIATGTETLDKIDLYIRNCAGVIHLVGEMTGASARPVTFQNLKRRYPDLTLRLPTLTSSIENGDPPLSYTQWEAYLAIYHRKMLVIATPKESAPRGPKFRPTSEARAAQLAHLERLRALGRYPEFEFANPDQLVSKVVTSSVLDLLAGEQQSIGVLNLIGCLFAIDGTDTLAQVAATFIAGNGDSADVLWMIFGVVEITVGVGAMLGWPLMRAAGFVVGFLGGFLAGRFLSQASSWTDGTAQSVWFVHQLSFALLCAAASLWCAVSFWPSLEPSSLNKRFHAAVILVIFALFVVWPGIISIIDAVINGTGTAAHVRLLAALVAMIGSSVYVLRGILSDRLRG
jgi:Domain of unknown function (DUF4062)